MSAQDRVFGCFPGAIARKETMAVQDEADHLVEVCAWVIFAGPEYGAQELGWGRSETEAWFDAAGLLGNQAA
jgi:hypothetical protein